MIVRSSITPRYWNSITPRSVDKHVGSSRIVIITRFCFERRTVSLATLANMMSVRLHQAWCEIICCFWIACVISRSRTLPSQNMQASSVRCRCLQGIHHWLLLSGILKVMARRGRKSLKLFKFEIGNSLSFNTI